MNLVPAEIAHLKILKTWFQDESSARQWGGPLLKYPFSDTTFQEEIGWQRMSNWSLLDEANELTGFGQYYEKAGRCHLARLVIAPLHRSKGLGRRLIQELMKVGRQDLDMSEYSLFVMNNNKCAIKCYRSLDFVVSPYPPGQQVFEDIDFMVRKHPGT